MSTYRFHEDEYDHDVIVTFDLFSALIDSRTGAAAAFAGIAESRGWALTGTELYDRWDAHNKALQARTSRRIADDGDDRWVSFRHLSTTALRQAYDELGLEANAADDYDVIAGSLAQWPLWPDVGDAVGSMRVTHRIGILSNVDDDLFAMTAAAPLADPAFVLTSQRLRAYKPDPLIYLRAAEHTGGHVHVAASRRDVRGSLEAGSPTVRVVRRGHSVDPDGPQPAYEIDTFSELPAALAQI